MYLTILTQVYRSVCVAYQFVQREDFHFPVVLALSPCCFISVQFCKGEFFFLSVFFVD